MNIGRITGLPVRVLSFRRICLPAEYLKYYGMSAGAGISVEAKNAWIKLFACNEGRKARAILRKNQVIQLPLDWIQRNHVKTGDFLFLLGLSDGMILYANLRARSDFD